MISGIVCASVGFTLPCGSKAVGAADTVDSLDFVGAVAALEAFEAELGLGVVELELAGAGLELVGALDAGLFTLLASLLDPPPVVGVDGVVFFPSSPDGEVILTVQ